MEHLFSRLQDAGEWDRALTVARSHDRIRLKETHFAYARFLEQSNRFGDAIEHYEAAGCHLCVIQVL